MREILFKAKTTKKHNKEHAFNGVWVEGDLIRSDGKYYIHPVGNRVKIDGELGKIIVMHEVDPTTLCQYTGLNDKNGKKIWENDLVEEDSRYFKGIVVYGEFDSQILKNIGFNINWKESAHYRNDIAFWNNEIKVCGNVFDNPELLEVE